MAGRSVNHIVQVARLRSLLCKALPIRGTSAPGRLLWVLIAVFRTFSFRAAAKILFETFDELT